jgi:cysteinyl-tRNA synthetase
LGLPGAREQLKASANALGLLQESLTNWRGRQRKLADIDEGEIEARIAARLAARAAKNWAESDRIRDELAAMGIVLKDHKDGATTWEVKR